MEDIDGHAHPRLARRSAEPRRRLPSRHIHVTTRHPTEFVDLTDRLERLVADAGFRSGILNVQTLHTTTAVVVNEHEPLLLTDFQALLEAAAPGDGRYRHDDTTARTVNLTDAERPNGHAHCRALLLPSSACLNVTRWPAAARPMAARVLRRAGRPARADLSVLLVGEAGQ